MTFTFTSTEVVPLTISSISVVDDATGSFSLTTEAPPPSVTLLQGETIDVTVEFVSSGLGAHSASLRIDSDAEPPHSTLFVRLGGVGARRWRCFDAKAEP